MKNTFSKNDVCKIVNDYREEMGVKGNCNRDDLKRWLDRKLFEKNYRDDNLKWVCTFTGRIVKLKEEKDKFKDAFDILSSYGITCDDHYYQQMESFRNDIETLEFEIDKVNDCIRNNIYYEPTEGIKAISFPLNQR